MGKQALEGIITVASAIVAIAIVATIVSKNSDTAGVLTAGGNALSGAIKAAVSPVNANAGNTQIGQTTLPNLLGQINTGYEND